MSELRWNALLGEWVATATHRQDRTFFPPEAYCPLCPTQPGGFPTEVPLAAYDLVVFENKFPSLQRNPPPPEVAGTDVSPVRPSAGACEVVVYTPDHEATLSDASVERIAHLVLVWRDRTRALYARPEIEHVFPFENKGAAIGVTLSHPHGQIYGYPFVPPILARELAENAQYRAAHGRCLLCDVRRDEERDGRRILARERGWVAYIPFAARYPYETHLVPTRCVADVTELDAEEIFGLARLLKRVLCGFDALFAVAFPYIMAVHQAPRQQRGYHLHLEFYPPMRNAQRLKYLAGSEAGAGMYINDTLAEEKAAELRDVIPQRAP